jgi:hypothetical protein
MLRWSEDHSVFTESTKEGVGWCQARRGGQKLTEAVRHQKGGDSKLDGGV